MDLMHLTDIVAAHPDAWFSIEPCRGETYSRVDEDALYAHYPYEESSVLAGQECRRFVDAWPVEETASHLAAAEAAGLDISCTGSTHRPISEVTAGLPGEDGFPEYGEMPDW